MRILFRLFATDPPPPPPDAPERDPDWCHSHDKPDTQDNPCGGK